MSEKEIAYDIRLEKLFDEIKFKIWLNEEIQIQPKNLQSQILSVSTFLFEGWLTFFYQPREVICEYFLNSFLHKRKERKKKIFFSYKDKKDYHLLPDKLSKDVIKFFLKRTPRVIWPIKLSLPNIRFHIFVTIRFSDNQLLRNESKLK